jgi:hypothetical protein
VDQLKEDRNLILRIDQYGKNLHDDEVDFVESASKWLESGKPLTTKMRKWAEDIERKRVD